jgi:predicted nucleic acid-binding protein
VIQVFDASAVVGMLLDTGASGRWCEERFTEASLAEPEHMPYEAANLVRRFAARKAIDASTADWALRRLVWMPSDYLRFDLLVTRAWHLRDNLTIYDAAYVAVAERLDARLVTLDRKLAGAPDLRCEVLVGPVS